jgi:hypothetical protein
VLIAFTCGTLALAVHVEAVPMTSRNQIEANRRDACKSTVQLKGASVRHGLTAETLRTALS